MHFRSLIFINAIWIATSQVALSQPAVAPAQSQKIAVEGGTIHLGNGEVIHDGVLVFDKGKIEYVGTDKERARAVSNRIDARGRHIYPGLIALCSGIGLNEIEQVRATLDQKEIGQWNPNIRSLTSYNTDSKIIPTLRSNGVLLAHVMPLGGVISGQSSVFQLDAWNWEDALIRADIAVHLHWPKMEGARRGQPGPKSVKSDQYREAVEEIQHYFNEAKFYLTRNELAEKHLPYEGLKGLWTGQKKLFIHVEQAKAMLHAVSFAQEMGVSYVLVVNDEVRHVLDFIREAGCPVVINPPHQLPRNEDDPIHSVYALPLLMEQAGILYAVRMEGYWEFRNLVFQAGQNASYGLPYEQSLASITLNAARILGIDSICGSIEAGKDATFFISEGDALDMMTHKVIRAFIRGRDIDLDNKHKELYRRFWYKYHPDIPVKY